MTKTNIQIFYHIFLENNWYQIFLDQLNKLIDSGLIKNSILNIGVVFGGSLNLDIEKKKLLNIINEFKTINILYIEHTGPCGESTTLAKLKDFCDTTDEDVNIFYLHTKGVSQFDSPREIPVKSWRNMMEYFLIEKWIDCVEKLNEGFDCCGINYQDHAAWIGNEHKLIKIFNGNFFWTKSSYVKKLNRNLLFEHRYSAENWISGSNPNVYSFHETPKHIDLYYQTDENYK